MSSDASSVYKRLPGAFPPELVHSQTTKKFAPEVTSQQRLSSSQKGQATEEWLRALDQLEAQPLGSSEGHSKPVESPQVRHKQLSVRQREGMDDEDVLDALERGEL